MRWVMLLKSKRIIVSNELKTNAQLDGSMIKKISSGGDALVARTHGGIETEFQPHFLALILANDLPKIIPYDKGVHNRVKIVAYDKSFVENPKNDLELLKDDNIETEMKTLIFRRALVTLLIDTYMNKRDKFEYEPAKVIEAKNSWIDTDELDGIASFLDDFDITDNIDDHEKSSNIEMWLKNKNLGISYNKFMIDLKAHCMKYNFKNVLKKKVVKDKGKRSTVVIGIRERDETDETPATQTDITDKLRTIHIYDMDEQ
jgi:phage/plasmid-associated DNA primase